MYGARLLDETLAEIGVPCGVAVDVGSEGAFLVPPAQGIVARSRGGDGDPRGLIAAINELEETGYFSITAQQGHGFQFLVMSGMEMGSGELADVFGQFCGRWALAIRHLTSLTDHLDGTRRLRLDRVGRITQVTGQDWTETYAYDTAGNLAHATWPQTHGEDAVGAREYTGTRLTTAGRWTFTYDEADRVIERRKTSLSRKPDVWRYAWDAEGRLVSCTTPDGTVWRYRYDPLGRRSAKQRLDAGGQVVEETVFTWDGNQLGVQRAHPPHPGGTCI
ncbi:RHS repeat domain-containing protein [Streptomyces sp. UG1]|uniref:RHS repeat domain-containing protein n=1 Tax=Streptomyces sp. UG1 TaxID=3417652 RepID=UPI003CEBC9FB